MAFDNIHNYFEKLVRDEIQDKITKNKIENSESFLSDVACVALNQLPSRYVRHDVDMVFYMTAEEREQNNLLVKNAVISSIDYVNTHRSN